MGLNLQERKSITREMRRKYLRASRAEKSRMLDQFTQLNHCGKRLAAAIRANPALLEKFCELRDVKPKTRRLPLRISRATSGDYAQIPTLTDVHTVWTEVAAVRNRAQEWVFPAVQHLVSLLPFPL